MCAAQWLPETRKELSSSLDWNIEDIEGCAKIEENDLAVALNRLA